MKRRILVVDDELELRQALEERLRSEGFDVCTACDGKEGLDKALSDKPNLILLDLMMPVMDGMTMLQELRQHDETKRTPVIILTAKGETISILDLQALKATDYFVKPFDSKELIAYIKRYI